MRVGVPDGFSPTGPAAPEVWSTRSIAAADNPVESCSTGTACPAISFGFGTASSAWCTASANGARPRIASLTATAQVAADPLTARLAARQVLVVLRELTAEHQRRIVAGERAADLLRDGLRPFR
ncbi:hypothetical protein ACQEVB_15835 [Pseudonocardia sp. CA-107938]|uniref:hypothetical protein n=1 Tax=Pseudonocardia sp. CA-107938 TaxID=3240021 RepID=UPI003D90FE93